MNYSVHHFKVLKDYLFMLILLLKKYFLPRREIENYNVLIDGKNFQDQPINDLIKQYDETRKVSTGQGDD